MYSHLNAFAGYGIRCELVAQDIENCLTPSGALKQGDWFVTMSFGRKIGGVGALKALRDYVSLLDRRLKGQAFKKFGQADMGILNQPC